MREQFSIVKSRLQIAPNETLLFGTCYALCDGDADPERANLDLYRHIDGRPECAPERYTATGTVNLTYNQQTKVLEITLFGSGFDSDVTFSNVHFGAIGENGPNRFFLDRTNTEPRVYEGSKVITLTPEWENEFLNGLWYIDIHTERFPRGEIRTQLLPVPEPASLLALSAGIAGLALRKRRR